MRKLLVYLKGYRKESILGPLFKLLEACIDLIVPLVMAVIIDRGIGDKEEGMILRLCLVLVGLGFVGLFLSVTAQFFAAKASVGFIKKVKHSLFSHIQSLSFSDVDRVGVSTLITRLTSDMNQVQTGMNLTLRLLLRSPFIVIGATVLALRIDGRIGLIFIFTVFFLSVAVFSIMLWCIPHYKRVQEALDAVLQKTRENLTGVRVIRAFCKEEDEIGEFKEKNKILTRLQKKVGRVSALMNPLTFIIVNLGIVVLIKEGALRVEEGSLTRGEIVALYNYMAQILVELVKFANMFLNITKSVASGNRIQAVLELCPGMEDGTESLTGTTRDTVVEFRGVSLNYYGKTSETEEENALSGINFKINKGETVGIIGGTGSGKTSLISLIPRFYDATKGEVLVYGKNVKDIKLSELRKKVSVVLQKAVLFKGSIRENLLFGKEKASDAELYEALRSAEAAEIVEKKTGGLDYFLDQGGRNLSGGQRQRFSIARALVGKPEILIFDDSFSALDYKTEASLRKNIKKLSYRPVILIVSQRASSVMHADKILVLEDGKIAGIGTHEELLVSSEEYREIYESQFKEREKGGEA